jgi:acyl-coenzyme A thioesterase PaaI-like protein
VCGRENPVGLKVSWDQDPEAGEIRGRVTVPAHFNGYPGVTHGGIVGALLDETAGRTILMDGGFEDLMVTAKLEVVYRRPTPTGSAAAGRWATAAADGAGGRTECAPTAQ